MESDEVSHANAGGGATKPEPVPLARRRLVRSNSRTVDPLHDLILRSDGYRLTGPTLRLHYAGADSSPYGGRMAVLDEILAWSDALGDSWVRDAFRRIVTQPEITDGDIVSLPSFAKGRTA